MSAAVGGRSGINSIRALIATLLLLLCATQWAQGEHFHLEPGSHFDECYVCQLSTGKAASAIKLDCHFPYAADTVGPLTAPTGAVDQLCLPAVRGPPRFHS